MLEFILIIGLLLLLATVGSRAIMNVILFFINIYNEARGNK